MKKFRQEEIVPKNGKEVRVLIVARYSTPLQDERSNDEQEMFVKEFVQRLTSLPCHYHSIKSQISGEVLDGAALQELEELIESGEWDIVICEDLSRICRRIHSHAICELCEDHDTRLIAINDNVDTSDEDWGTQSFFAAFRHEKYNKDNAKRVRRSQRGRFKNGGILPKQIFGYIRPPGAKTEAELSIDPQARPVVEEVFRLLENGASYAEVADWLNSQKVPTGPSCRIREWRVASVRRFVRNPLLKGFRFRNREITRRINKTGHRKIVPAPPEEYLERECPHLAFFEPGYVDYVLGLIKERNSKKGRPKNDASKNPRLGIPTKRTSFPAQHARCNICGNLMYMTCESAGKKQITCSGAMKYHCWNSLYIGTDLAREEICTAVSNELQHLSGFEVMFHKQLTSALQKSSSNQSGLRVKYEREIADLTRKIGNVTDSIANYGGTPELHQTLKTLTDARQVAKFELAKIERSRCDDISIPTWDEIKQSLEQNFSELINGSDEAGRLICRVLPEIFIRPVELCDGRTVEPQAIVTLDLQPIVALLTGYAAPIVLPVKTLIVNLFETRPYVKHASAVGSAPEGRVVLTGQRLGLSLGEIGMSRKLFRISQQRGLQDFWLPLTEPPERGWKGKRHLHPRYRFEPLPGFEPRKVA